MIPLQHTPGFGMMGASGVGDSATPRGRGRGGRGRGRGRGFNNGGGYGQGGKTHLRCSRHTVFSSKKLVDMINMIVRVSKQHIKCVIFPGGFGTYGYGNSANSGYSEYSFHPL